MGLRWGQGGNRVGDGVGAGVICLIRASITHVHIYKYIYINRCIYHHILSNIIPHCRILSYIIIYLRIVFSYIYLCNPMYILKLFDKIGDHDGSPKCRQVGGKVDTSDGSQFQSAGLHNSSFWNLQPASPRPVVQDQPWLKERQGQFHSVLVVPKVCERRTILLNATSLSSPCYPAVRQANPTTPSIQNMLVCILFTPTLPMVSACIVPPSWCQYASACQYPHLPQPAPHLPQ